MVAIFRMHQFEAVPSLEFFRLIAENLGGGRAAIQYFILRIDYRDGIRAVLDKGSKAFKTALPSVTSSRS